MCSFLNSSPLLSFSSISSLALPSPIILPSSLCFSVQAPRQRPGREVLAVQPQDSLAWMEKACCPRSCLEEPLSRPANWEKVQQTNHDTQYTLNRSFFKWCQTCWEGVAGKAKWKMKIKTHHYDANNTFLSQWGVLLQSPSVLTLLFTPV